MSVLQRAMSAALIMVVSSSAWAAPRPKWTKGRPHFETREGWRFAVAVGKAKLKNPALARADAEEKARASLLRFLEGKSEVQSAEGPVAGARVSEVFEAANGTVYVRLEVPAGASASK